jgi:hypothetical protein
MVKAEIWTAAMSTKSQEAASNGSENERYGVLIDTALSLHQSVLAASARTVQIIKASSFF